MRSLLAHGRYRLHHALFLPRGRQLLPAADQEAALIQLDALDQRERLLELGFARIDLRTPEEVAVRPSAGEA